MRDSLRWIEREFGIANAIKNDFSRPCLPIVTQQSKMLCSVVFSTLKLDDHDIIWFFKNEGIVRVCLAIGAAYVVFTTIYFTNICDCKCRRLNGVYGIPLGFIKNTYMMRETYFFSTT